MKKVQVRKKAPKGKRIVLKVEEGMDPRDILCTTYQMRNPFHQFADGVAGELDVHCYFQHAAAADLCPPKGRVLDVCCGRGLLIPFLRYRAKPSLYVGVDIEAKNAPWRGGVDPRRRGGELKEDGWGFNLVFIQSNVSVMAHEVRASLPKTDYHLIVYTSAIEHMQKEDQVASLQQCGELGRKDSTLYLTFPVTEEGRDGYDTQYAAHVYEPKESEVREWLKESGWRVERRIGLVTKASVFKQRLQGKALESALVLYRDLPRLQSLTTIAAVYPQSATEIALVCRKSSKRSFWTV